MQRLLGAHIHMKYRKLSSLLIKLGQK